MSGHCQGPASDARPFKDFPKISQPELLVGAMTLLFDSHLNSDVIFLVEGRKFHAHRNILAVRSPVFSVMLLNKSFKEANKTDEQMIELPGKRALPFEIFLRSLYTYSIDLVDSELETVISVLSIAHEYQVTDLIATLSCALQKVVGRETVFQLFECALLLMSDETALLSSCRNFFNVYAATLLKDPKFFKLSKKAVIDLISADEFGAEEIDVLMAVYCWHELNKKEDIKSVLEKIRFQYVSLATMTMAKIAPIYNILIAAGIDLEVVGQQSSPESSFYLSPRKTTCDKNVAIPANGASVEGVQNSYSSYPFANGTYVDYQPMTNPMIICLPITCTLTSMAFDIYSQQNGGFCGYMVETSLDKATWQCLIDMRSESCYRKQLLMFNPQRVRYVKISGCKANHYNYTFGISSFECPTNVTEADRTRYFQNCPYGGALLLQVNVGSVKKFPVSKVIKVKKDKENL